MIISSSTPDRERHVQASLKQSSICSCFLIIFPRRERKTNQHPERQQEGSTSLCLRATSADSSTNSLRRPQKERVREEATDNKSWVCCSLCGVSQMTGSFFPPVRPRDRSAGSLESTTSLASVWVINDKVQCRADHSSLSSHLKKGQLVEVLLPELKVVLWNTFYTTESH
ncbi:hypothetical protein SRHO_G00042130 [Serrasalmus rhombeus]